MKKYSEYILVEALKSDQQKFIKNIYNVELALLDADKLVNINIKANELKKITNPLTYKEFGTDKIFTDFINNTKIGFPITSAIIKNKEIDKNNETIFLNAYWKNTEDEITFFAGIILYDIKSKLIDNYLTIVNIESALFLKDIYEFGKIMFNDFVKNDIKQIFAETKKTYKGLAIKPINQKHIVYLNKIGFKQNKENKNILIYDL